MTRRNAPGAPGVPINVRALALVLALGCTPPPVAGAEHVAAKPVTVPLVGRLGRYAGRFDVGRASFSLAIDTGSRLLAVAGPGCDACDRDGTTAYYAPGPHAIALHRQGRGAYDEGQLGWTGDAYVDTVAVDGLAAPVELFAMTDETDIVVVGDDVIHADGLLGLGGSGDTNWPDALARSGVPDVFAIHKCDTDGTLWIGGYAGAQAASYVPASSRYEVALHAVGLGSARFELPADTTAVVDSGTAGLVVPPATYNAIVAELDRDPVFSRMVGSADAWFAQAGCTLFPEAQIDKLPPLTLELDGVSITLPASQSYAMPWPPDEVCPVLAAREDWVAIGDLPMRSNVVIFDRENKRIGFAPSATACND